MWLRSGSHSQEVVPPPQINCTYLWVCYWWVWLRSSSYTREVITLPPPTPLHTTPTCGYVTDGYGSGLGAIPVKSYPPAIARIVCSCPYRSRFRHFALRFWNQTWKQRGKGLVKMLISIDIICPNAMSISRLYSSIFINFIISLLLSFLILFSGEIR